MYETARGSGAVCLAPPVSERATCGLDSSGLTSSFEPGMPDAWSERFDELSDIRCLEDDWDGMGAEAPSAELVGSAIELAKRLRRGRDNDPPSRIVAGPAGTVLFEWQSSGCYQEIEIVEPYQGEWMGERSGCPNDHAVLRWSRSRH